MLALLSRLAHYTLIFCFCLASVVHADERILSFHSDITISEDSSMRVQETIRVRAEGKDIRRGIYREFPTTYEDRYGNTIEVVFDVQSVTRDGVKEPWHRKRLSNGDRIYIGDADTFLENGEYAYAITYATNRQIGFFEDHDELYWNVTGNGWQFTIDAASATVTLPQQVAQSHINLQGFTGKVGSREEDVAQVIRDGSATLQTTVPLESRAGLTLVMQWPKGIVSEPTDWQRLKYLLQDNVGLLVSLLALLGSGLYLLFMWSRYGRDPVKGVIFPHYEPPEGYSPAAARYINEMGYDKETFTAAVINLAVKGHLSITSASGDYSLKRCSSKTPLARGEEAIINKLFSSGTELELKSENHLPVSLARGAHEAALKKDYLHSYFKTNAALLVPSLVISILLLFLLVSIAQMVPMAFVIFAIILVLHIIFAFLLKAPSIKGRQMMDKLEGFKLYLEVAEKDDLNLRNPPELTPALFEAYLPFAIALGVEHAWSKQFAQVFAHLSTQGKNDYRPNWYHGNFSPQRMSHFSSSVGSNLSSAISSASTAPGSSSGGGGGGSSGGGGGGGGGGGW